MVPATCEILIDAGCEPLREHLTAAFASVPGEPVRIVLRWIDVASTLASERSTIEAARVVILGLRGADGAPTTDLVQGLRACQPALGLYVFAADHTLLNQQLRQYTVADIDDAFQLQHEVNGRELRTVVTGRLLAPAPEGALWRFRDGYKTLQAYRAAAHCLRNAYRVQRVGEVARRLGQHRATLCTHLHSGKFPCPADLLRLGCDLHARTLERAGDLSHDEIALRVGRPSAEALREMQRRLRRAARIASDLQALWIFFGGDRTERKARGR